MSNRRATVTEAEYRRALKAAVQCGLTVREVEVTPSKVRLIFSDSATTPDSEGGPGIPKEWPR